MLVKDLDGIIFESDQVSVTVFDSADGTDVIDDLCGKDWSYVKRIYGDLQIDYMFPIISDGKSTIKFYISFLEPEKKLSPELQSIMECYEDFSEFVEDCGMRALL